MNSFDQFSGALFLDRDGVINLEKNYVFQIEDVEFVPGIFELAGLAKAKGYKVIVVTNQSGIARGFYSESQFLKLMAWMRSEFERNASGIDAVYHCPFHPIHGIGHYKKDSDLRKPKPGMILQAQAEHSLDLKNSFMIGDRISDMQAGLAAGVGHNFLLSKGSKGINLSNGFSVVPSLTEILPYI